MKGIWGCCSDILICLRNIITTWCFFWLSLASCRWNTAWGIVKHSAREIILFVKQMPFQNMSLKKLKKYWLDTDTTDIVKGIFCVIKLLFPPIIFVPCDWLFNNKQAAHRDPENPSLQDQLIRENSNLKDENNRLRSENSNLRDENNNLRIEAKQQVNDLQQKMELREQTFSKRINELTNKLSEEMSKKIAADESSVENVNIKNRPMNIADDYVHFCSNEWLAAKTVLDDLEDSDEGDKVQLLFHILMVADTEMKAHHKGLLAFVTEVLYSTDWPSASKAVEPGSEYTPDKNPKLKSTGSLPLQVTNAIGDFLRVQADAVEINTVNVYERLNGDFTSENKHLGPLWGKGKATEEVKEYILSSLRLCWKMATQRPAMTFKTSDKYLGDKHQDLFWKSADPADASVTKCQTVYPMVYHGASLMAKGKVYLMK